MAKPHPVLCIGGLHFDSIAQSLDPVQMKASNPVHCARVAGGVAHNIACDLVAMGTPSSLLSLVGDDADGRQILEDTKKRGVDLSLVSQMRDVATASYTAVLDPSGELVLGLSDTATYDLVTPEFLEPFRQQMQQHKTVVIDANLPEQSLVWLGEQKGDARLFAAPVSPSKARRWKQAIAYADVFICNEREADQLTTITVGSVSQALQAARALRELGPSVAVVTLGPEGAVISSSELEAHFAIPETNVVDVNGAGDAFFAGFTRALHTDSAHETAMKIGIATASIMAETPGPIWHGLSIDRVNSRLENIPPHMKIK